MLHGIARRLSKDVKLVMAGGELTADMHTCEELADVIKHILRHVVENSVELPAQRVRAGKPAPATIHLQARQTTTRLIVEITDDGAALNEPGIKHKGLRKNFLRAEDVDATPTFAASERQILQGLNATDAGMDAARAAVLRLNGSLEVQTTPGSGSVFTIQLPIGAATTPVIVVRVGNHSYAIPAQQWRPPALSPPTIF
jgi:two-component system chemotaxis sensor kinase CheA